jgi:cation diffusion facilitator family transporter
MSSASSRKVVWAAIIGNSSIAVTKFVAALVTGSSAMLSEAIHSLVDTGNQLLLLLGIHRSEKPPDDVHPFGHGKERYFWSLIVAVVLFSMGGGMAMYEGIIHLIHPTPIIDPTWAYVVLAAAALFEGYSWFVALKEVRAESRGRGIWQTVRESKAIATITVLLEDSAALLGIVVAFVGIFIGHQYENLYSDGIASIIIGAMLGLVALILVRECRDLLLGEGASPETVASIRKIVLEDEAVVKLNRLLTMHLGPHEILLNLDAEFSKGLSADGVTATVTRVEKKIRDQHPEVTRIFIEAAPFRGIKTQLS